MNLEDDSSDEEFILEDGSEPLEEDEDEEISTTDLSRLQQYWQLLQQHLLGFAGEEEEEESEEEANLAQDPTQPGKDPYIVQQQKELMEHPFAHDVMRDAQYHPGRTQTNVLAMLNKRGVCGGWRERDRSGVGCRYMPHFPTVFDRYHSQIFCGKFSHSGQLYMTACQDRHIRLYDAESWSLKKEIVARDVGWSIIDTDFSGDERWLIYSSWSDYVQLCNVVGEHQVHEALDLKPDAHRFCLFSLKFSPDSSEILGGSSDHNLYIYDLERRQVSLKVEGHGDDINSVCYLEGSNKNVMVSGSDDTLCKLWDRRQLSQQHPKPVGAFPGHLQGITHVSSKNDGRYFISNSKDQSIKLWDIRKIKDADVCDAEAKNHGNFDYRYGDTYLGRNQRSVLAGKRHHSGDVSLMTYRGHKVFQTLIRSYFSPLETTGQAYIYAGSYDGSVYMYDVLTGEIVQQLTGHRATVRDSSWHPTSPLLASTSWDGSVRLWSYEETEVKEAKKRRKERSSYDSEQ